MIKSKICIMSLCGNLVAGAAYGNTICPTITPQQMKAASVKGSVDVDGKKLKIVKGMALLQDVFKEECVSDVRVWTPTLSKGDCVYSVVSIQEQSSINVKMRFNCESRQTACNAKCNREVQECQNPCGNNNKCLKKCSSKALECARTCGAMCENQ